MRKREMIALLNASGFRLRKKNRHDHYVNEDGTRITIPQGPKVERRLSKFIKVQIRRAAETGQTLQA